MRLLFHAAQILKACGLQNFLAVNVLADMEIFQNLPLTPTGRPSPALRQGELIGGSDIMTEMYQRVNCRNC